MTPLQKLNKEAAEKELRRKGKRLRDYPWPEDVELLGPCPFCNKHMASCICDDMVAIRKGGDA